MNRVQRRIVSLLCAGAVMAFASQANARIGDFHPRADRSTGAPAPVIGRAIVIERGFDVVYWDSVNGMHTVARGLEPAISSNGRFVTYIGRNGKGCNPVRLYDVRARRGVPLPGLNTGDCNDNPAVSGDGHFLAYESRATAPGDPGGIFLYDVVNQQKIELPEPVGSTSTEESPTLSDDGSLMAFVSGRNGPAFDDIFVADISNPGAPVLIPLPGLNTNEAERDAYMSGDASTIAFVTGPTPGRRVSIYDRASATVVTPPPLSGAYDTFDPALNRDGSLAVVARQAIDLGDTAVALYNRATSKLTRPRVLRSRLGDENPGIADGVELIDDTPPAVKLRCRSPKDDSIKCRLTMSERARVKVVARLDGVTAKGSKRFLRAGTKRVALHFKQDVRGKAKVAAKAVDFAGLVGRAKDEVRVR
jgi:hypothetical protein